MIPNDGRKALAGTGWDASKHYRCCCYPRCLNRSSAHPPYGQGLFQTSSIACKEGLRIFGVDFPLWLVFAYSIMSVVSTFLHGGGNAALAVSLPMTVTYATTLNYIRRLRSAKTRVSMVCNGNKLPHSILRVSPQRVEL